jgi:isopenicillin N synthase-like dioxygenase
MNTQAIPVIDIKNLRDNASLQALDEACRNWGCFQVVNHGIDAQVIEDVKHQMHEFFAMPKDVKRAISRTADNPWGYFDQELTKNTLDWKEVFDYGPAESSTEDDERALVPRWPRGMPRFRQAVLSYYRACEGLGFALLDAIGMNLGMHAGALAAPWRQRHTSFVRLNYYPICPKPARPVGACPAEDGYLGVNHHTDAGALTLLLQADEPGLEVFHGGTWHLVPPSDDALVINIGDIVQVWSNDRYRAGLHRVTANAERARFSAPFFLNPAYDARYAPLPSTVDAAHPARYRAIQWGEFRRLRSAGDYADQGEEIQISHYAVGG